MAYTRAKFADLIDGKDTAEGWGIGWGIRTDPESVKDSALGTAGML